MLRLGAHVSIAGGVDKAIPLGKKVGCEVLQIFTKSSNQWAARPLREEEIVAFHENRETVGVPVVAAHDSYLINLGSPDEALYRKSIDAFRHEMQRCEMLGLAYLVTHPGAHVGSGEKAGIARIASALDELHADAAGYSMRVLLEITAGQGSCLGYRFEHIAEILDSVRDPERIGVCFDTCHAHAAGYDLRTERGYRKTFREFDRIVGLERIRAFHLNDCKRELASRMDRHWHIGRGLLGLEPFRLLMNDPRFDGVAGFLETPKGKEYFEDVENLRVLRALVGDRVPKPIPREVTPLPGGAVKAGAVPLSARRVGSVGLSRPCEADRSKAEGRK